MFKSKRNILNVLLILVAAAVLLYRGSGFIKKIFDKSGLSLKTAEKVEYQRDSNEENELSRFSFAIIGDTREFANDKAKYLSPAVRNIAETNVDLVFAMGDLVSSCDGGKKCEDSFNLWKEYMQPLLPITYGVQGNHDRSGGDKADSVWRNEFDFPGSSPDTYDELAYSFNFGNSHFVVLDTEKPKEHAISDAQLDWLDYDLGASGKINNFIFFHEPAFPVSSKIGNALDANISNRNRFWSILDSHGVTAVFSGHEHIFSRRLIDENVFPGAKNSIYQFVAGNTDAPLEEVESNNAAEYVYSGHHYVIVDVDGDNVVVNLYAADGKFIDSFAFSK